MTEQERAEYRSRMRTATSEQERERIRLEHHAQMQERAAELGIELPDAPPMTGMGQGMGQGQGMGAGRGGMLRQGAGAVAAIDGRAVAAGVGLKGRATPAWYARRERNLPPPKPSVLRPSRMLRAAMSWERYAEVFAYDDDHTETFSL